MNLIVALAVSALSTVLAMILVIGGFKLIQTLFKQLQGKDTSEDWPKVKEAGLLAATIIGIFAALMIGMTVFRGWAFWS